MTRYVYSLLLAMAALFTAMAVTSCNKDDVIEEISGKPEIILDSETGIYNVKTGHELVIAPEVRNAEGARYTWTVDNNVIATTPVLRVTYAQACEIYVTFTVTTSHGSASEELKIVVTDLAPPVISLTLPPEGLNILPGTEYVITPDYTNVDDDFSVQWWIDDVEVADSESLKFKRDEPGTYRVKVRATNADGSTERTFTVNVTNQLPLAVSFPPLSYFNKSTDVTAVAGRPVFLHPELKYFAAPAFEWRVDGVPVSGANGPTFSFTPDRAGTYKVSVNVSEPTGASVKAEVTVNCFASQGAPRPANATSSASQNKVYEYVAAPGQFINDTDVLAAFTGNETTHEQALGYATDRMKKGLFVSLGGFGGYMTVGFDHSIMSGNSDYDFAITGNAFKESNEPGIVWVMQDTNGNGLPDDTWYELRGSDTGSDKWQPYYTVTYYRPAGAGMNVRWTDSEGLSGIIRYLYEFHKQPCYYPAWVDAECYTLRGSRLASNMAVEASGKWVTSPFAWGYADNLGSDAEPSNADGTGQLNRFRISDAIHPDGTPANLEFIDFIKVQTAVNDGNRVTGESSTDVCGFIDLAIGK